MGPSVIPRSNLIVILIVIRESLDILNFISQQNLESTVARQQFPLKIVFQ